MNRQVEVTWRKFRTIAHSITIHAKVSKAYINFSIMYTTDNIFPVLPLNDMLNEDSDPTTPFKLAIGMKSSVSHLRVLFCPCVARKDTEHVKKRR